MRCDMGLELDLLMFVVDVSCRGLGLVVGFLGLDLILVKLDRGLMMMVYLFFIISFSFRFTFLD
jgi:hypothetical protein